jgi:hypothetical protein
VATLSENEFRLEFTPSVTAAPLQPHRIQDRMLMDRITKSLLDEFSRDYGLDRLAEDVRFEHFASFVTVHRLHSETFDTSEIVLSASGGMGIDAIATIVNGNLIADIDSFNEMADEVGYLDVTFIFVQADRGSNFEAAKMGNFGFAVVDFFREKPELPRSKEIQEAAELMGAIYDKSSKFKRGNPSCRLYYVTTGKWTRDQTLEARRANVITDLTTLGVFREVSLTPVGADLLQQLYNETKNSISREFSFPNRTSIPDVEGVKEAYLGFLAAPTFLSIIEDEEGDIIKSIFYDNVRDWQGESPVHVNAEISETIRSDHKDRFVLMNNGVTIIARNLQVTGHKCSIEDFQIVNGCQTSHVLAGNEDAVDETVMIPLRLISTQDEGVIESIIRATNRQTEVKKEQFFAVTEFAKQLERFFQAFPEEHQLFYERRSRQYDSQQVEKTRVVVPQNVIRAFAAMFLAEPHRTARSYKLLDAQVGDKIFAEGHKLDPYYTSAFALYKMEYMFRNQKIDRSYRNARFQILLAARLLYNGQSLPRMNSREMENYCAGLNSILWKPVSADRLFTRATGAVHRAAAGNLERDNIHTQPFTEKLMAQISGTPQSAARKKSARR